jgi:hypothetical protein
MSGIDDYCPGNRNPLGVGQGFDACLALLETLKPDTILNCHVDLGFQFSAAQYRTMRENLVRRKELYRQLLPWDDPNYGLDEQWIRCHPYEQSVVPGGTARLEVVITNHSAVAHTATCSPSLPTGWGGDPRQSTALVAPGAVGRLGFRVDVPARASPGLYVVPVQVAYGSRELGHLREALLRVVGRTPATRDGPCT